MQIHHAESGTTLFRALPRSYGETPHNMQDTSSSSNATNSQAAQDDAELNEQHALATQESEIRHCCKHGIGPPQGQHEKEKMMQENSNTFQKEQKVTRMRAKIQARSPTLKRPNTSDERAPLHETVHQYE